MVVPRALRAEVIRALRAAHPYEEPAFDLLPMADLPGRSGLGRVGELDREVSLAEFADRVAVALPSTEWGVRAAGDPDLRVRTVAVCGGSGSSLIPLARAAGAQVFVTSDLKHHQVVEQVTERAIAAAAELRGDRRGALGHRGAVPGSARDPPARAIRHYRRGSRVNAGHRSVDPARPISRIEPDPTVKADPAAQLRLLDLQGVDTALAQLRHRRATLPELAKIAAAVERADGVRTQQVEVQTALDDTAGEQRRLENEVETVRTRAGRDNQRMTAGGLPAKELEGLQHETHLTRAPAVRARGRAARGHGGARDPRERAGRLRPRAGRNRGRAGRTRSGPRRRLRLDRFLDRIASRKNAARWRPRCRPSCSRSMTRSPRPTAGSAPPP